MSSSEIVRIRDHGNSVCAITTGNGESYTVADDSCYVAHLAELNNSHVIHAQPGYSVIHVVKTREDTEWQYVLFPVVGWSILPVDDDIFCDRRLISVPVVAGNLEGIIGPDLVLPDGRVIRRSGNVFKDVGKWFDAEAAYRTNILKGKQKSRRPADNLKQ